MNNQLQFPRNNDEAEERFIKNYYNDPFEDIPPALLNSYDISKYVKAAGIVHPFISDKEEKKLKAASYEVDFAGELLYWEDGNTKDYKRQNIVNGKRFIIPKNSIVYVWTEAFFRLPQYIALRFNLRIKHVHRGLLLGTGPLVDPGFSGRLLIPLHNLTSESYAITGGEGLIWVEFTKISPLPLNEGTSGNGSRNVHIPSQDMTPEKYLGKAGTKDGAPPLSAIREAVEQFNKTRKKIKKFQFATAIAIGGLILAAGATVWPVIELIQDTNEYVSETTSVVSGRLDKQRSSIVDIQQQLRDLNKQKAIILNIEQEILEIKIRETKHNSESRRH